MQWNVCLFFFKFKSKAKHNILLSLVPHVRAVVYQTYSKYPTENEELVNKTLLDFNETRKSSMFPYK